MNAYAAMAQAVERILGKDEVGGSSPPSSSRKPFCLLTKGFFQYIKGVYPMIILISGASHTGKTLLAQKLLEKYKYPYLSVDHLKMGLIRSGETDLTPEDDKKLTPYLWNIVKEMIKTAIENNQNLIFEGCYIPYDWQKDFSEEYLDKIKYICLIMSDEYIRNHFEEIKRFSNIIENRICDDISKEILLTDNAEALDMCKKHSLDYILINEEYKVDYSI